MDLKITPLDLAPWPSSASSLGRQLSMLPSSPAFHTQSREQQARRSNSTLHHGCPGDLLGLSATIGSTALHLHYAHVMRQAEAETCDGD